MITLRFLSTSGLARVSEQDGKFRTRQQDAQDTESRGQDISELRNAETLLRDLAEFRDFSVLLADRTVTRSPHLTTKAARTRRSLFARFVEPCAD